MQEVGISDGDGRKLDLGEPVARPPVQIEPGEQEPRLQCFRQAASIRCERGSERVELRRPCAVNVFREPNVERGRSRCQSAVELVERRGRRPREGAFDGQRQVMIERVLQPPARDDDWPDRTLRRIEVLVRRQAEQLRENLVDAVAEASRWLDMQSQAVEPPQNETEVRVVAGTVAVPPQCPGRPQRRYAEEFQCRHGDLAPFLVTEHEALRRGQCDVHCASIAPVVVGRQRVEMRRHRPGRQFRNRAAEILRPGPPVITGRPGRLDVRREARAHHSFPAAILR
ncbi:hypothetical protein DKT77_17670 [Meridianimarinicoccus roseus]|uniref:Uncharacterized protein n=1 Tax=Meridianimarinicoccus roseus TaxID=2072018 RepID=A0A2V2LDH9_9RHOB|nr:hypothetical protein DKT77_17670 [Meridianimarinicoccus roseus]